MSDNKKQTSDSIHGDRTIPFVDLMTGEYFNPPTESVIYTMNEKGEFIPAKDSKPNREGE